MFPRKIRSLRWNSIIKLNTNGDNEICLEHWTVNSHMKSVVTAKRLNGWQQIIWSFRLISFAIFFFIFFFRKMEYLFARQALETLSFSRHWKWFFQLLLRCYFYCLRFSYKSLLKTIFMICIKFVLCCKFTIVSQIKRIIWRIC